MIIDTKVISDFIELQGKIEKLFIDGLLEKKRFSEAIGISRLTLARKLKEKSFSPEELLKLANEINNVLSIK